MPLKCGVEDCKNSVCSKLKNKENINPNSVVIFHSFPANNAKLTKEWLKFCGKHAAVNPTTSKICSVHFKADDYIRDLEHELLGLPIRKKRRLKPDAVPSVLINQPSTSNQGSIVESIRGKRATNRQRRKSVQEILESYDRDPLQRWNPPPKPVKATQTVLKQKNIDTLQNQLVKAVKLLERKNNIINRLKTKNRCLRDRAKSKQLKSVQFKSITKTPSNQISPSSRKRRHWKTAEVIRALHVRSVSLKAYQTALEVWKVDLPPARTLRQWILNFDCAPGILTEVLQMMKCRSEKLSQLNRLCALTFDEISINSTRQHDKKEDRIVSFSKAQVVMVRGLCEPWKQIVYFEFDTRMTKERLFKILEKVESSNYIVCCITSDLGGENRSVWNILDIGIDKSSFESPTDPSRLIFVLADAPHMIKLNRNHLIDDGVTLSSGTVINLQTLEALLKVDNNELKLCPKFNQTHLNLVKAQRMRVEPAAQVFSHHVATLAKKVFPGNLEISEFFQLFNDGFDIMNSRALRDSSCVFRNAYRAEKYQTDVLCKLRDMILSMRYFSKRAGDRKPLKSLLPCQIGFAVTINSTIQMFDYLQRKYGLEYLLTSRINQDCLESSFSQIRGMGGPNTNPTPVEFRYRIRMLILGKTYKQTRGSNVVVDDDTFMTADLIVKNDLRSEPLNLIRKPITQVVNDIGTNDEDSLFYLAGYLAWKIKRKGTAVYGSIKKMRLRGDKSWITMLSRGGLLTPSKKMKDWVCCCNRIFVEFMKSNATAPQITAKLIAQIKMEEPNIPPEVIKEFVTVRLKIRLKCLNSTRKYNRVNQQKAKHFLDSSH